MSKIEEGQFDNLTHGSLFSGIGGFDLAAEWAGWENVFYCEWNEFGQKVLKYHFPKSISHNDITKTDFTTYRNRIDVLSGGFPCQPYSTAGKRLGKEDERHLWPEMLRAIREIQPSWVVGENVRGLINWNGGMVFDEVQTDLEAEGYYVQPFLLPACGVNAPHRRDRIWFVAYSDKCNDRRIAREDESKSGKERVQQRDEIREPVKSGEVFGDVSDTNGSGLQKARPKQQTTGTEQYGELGGNVTATDPQRRSSNWQEFPTKPPVCGGNDGLPRELDSITLPKWRSESIKAYGNAVVPQVVYQIFQSINQYNEQDRGKSM